MKKRVVQALSLCILLSGLLGFSHYNKYYTPQLEMVVSDNQNNLYELFEEKPTIEKSNVVEVGIEEEEVNVISEPLIFPDAYFNPETEEYREEEYWDDMELVALVCVAEAEGESEYGKRLVIDTVFNRMDSPYFPNDIKDIVYAEGQWECVANGRINRVENNEYIAQLVMEEYNDRTNSDVVYFRTEDFFEFGTPIINEGSHYFSGR